MLSRLLSFVLVASLAPSAHAVGPQKRTATSSAAAQRPDNHPAAAFDRLDRATALPSYVPYEHFVGPQGGGVCPIMGVAHLTQGLASMTKRGVVDVDAAIRHAYASIPSLQKGRLSNEQVIAALDLFQKNLLPNLHTTTRVDYHSALQPQTTLSSARSWTNLGAKLLEPKANELKLISYTVSDRITGEVHGRHFVVLKDAQGSRITVVDSNAPTKDYTYDVKRIALPGQAGHSLELIRPKTLPAEQFTVNTVFTVTLDSQAKD